MKEIKELTGKRFGRWKVLKYLGNSNCLCQCDCGVEKIVKDYNLISNKSKSCGCLQKEIVSKKNFKHKLGNSKIYYVWRDMRTRCENKNVIDYKNYGGRGITICKEWVEDFLTFYNWAMDNGYKEGLTLDRIDNNGNYEPSNCHWVDRKYQVRNRRNTKKYVIEGRKYTIMELAEKYSMAYTCIYARLQRGWTIEESVRRKSNGRTKR